MCFIESKSKGEVQNLKTHNEDIKHTSFESKEDQKDQLKSIAEMLRSFSPLPTDTDSFLDTSDRFL